MLFDGMEHVVCSLFGKAAYGKDLTELSGNVVRQVLADISVSVMVCWN